MTLKRSLSQKFKSTLEKTKRIVSSSSLSSFDNHSPSVSDSFSFNSTDFSTPLTSTSTTFNDATDFGGLGIQYNKDSISLNRKSSNLDPPTLLYSRKKRSGTMSRSIPNRKQSIDLIDTSTPTNITSSIPTPVSQDDLLSLSCRSNYSFTQNDENFENDTGGLIILPSGPNDDDDIDDDDNNNNHNNNNNNHNNNNNNHNNNNNNHNNNNNNHNNNNNNHNNNNNNHNNNISGKLNNTNSNDNNKTTIEGSHDILLSAFLSHSAELEKNSSYLDSQSQDRPSILIPSNYSSTTTSYTLNSFAENSAKCNMDLLESHEIIQDDVDSIFTKSNQIDHLDKDLDTRKNDLLADQMALNILQNIDEEDVDELSKLKEEISMI
ncbi:unnamed protein product [Pichia kudriavzevii]